MCRCIYRPRLTRRWYLTDDNRIAITGGDQCLDEGDNGVQTYQCTTGNTNQGMLAHRIQVQH